MRLLVTIQDHFAALGNDAFSRILPYEQFWKRYLSVFDSVLVVSRAKPVDKVPANWNKVTGPGVEFCAIPDYTGPWQFLRQRSRILKIIRDVLKSDDSYIFRVPGNIGTQIWRQLPHGYPFGVEVVIDPWDVFAPGSVRNLARPFFRRWWTHNLKLQCQQAVAASYVTEHVLQQRYPPGKDAYTTHYSSIDLSPENLCSDTSRRLEAISAIPARLAGDGPPVRLGFIGSFSQGYKLPDIHIKAFAQCIAKGANLTLEMIGDGTLLENMKVLAKKSGVSNRINFRGRLPAGKALMDAIDTFDLFLNATAAEGLPRVVIEAMSRGCPCIASNVAGTPELLEQKYLVPPGDVTALTDTIFRVLAHPESMAETVERNVRIARNYCKDILQPRRDGFYAELRKRTEKYLSKKL